MVARLGINFRFGNLAEHLGSLLLRGIAAVADVPRTEDVGIDAIATLLRPDEDGNCYAEDTFTVQFKAAGAKSIAYSEHELSWFLNQTQPFFVGRIDLDAGMIELFPTIHANQAVQALEPTKIELRLDPFPNPPGIFPGMPWKGKEHGATVWLGPPLLSWAVSDLKRREWSTETYDTLKRFLRIAIAEKNLLAVGQRSQIEWQTNNLGSINSFPNGMKYDRNSLLELAQRCAPGLESLLMIAAGSRGDDQSVLAKSLLATVGALKKLGVEIDRYNVFQTVAAFEILSAAERDEASTAPAQPQGFVVMPDDIRFPADRETPRLLDECD